MSDIVPADAPMDATTAEEFVERYRSGERRELVERLTTAQRQVGTALTLLTRQATMLEEEGWQVIQGPAEAGYNLGVLAESAENGWVADTAKTDDALRADFARHSEEDNDDR